MARVARSAKQVASQKKASAAAALKRKVAAHWRDVDLNGPRVSVGDAGQFKSTPLKQKGTALHKAHLKALKAKGVASKPATGDWATHKSSGWGMGD